MLHVIAPVIPPPVAVADTEKEPKEGPRLAPTTMPKDAAMELTMDSPTLALEDREIQSLAPALGAKSVGEDVDSIS